LRAARETAISRIRHIPAILYHRREEGALSPRLLPKSAAAARRAKIEHLRVLSEDAGVEPHPKMVGADRIRRHPPEPAPLVSLIVPTHNRADLTGPCLEGLLLRTTYPNFEIIIIDHQSDEPETKALLQSVSCDSHVRIMPYQGAFNYSDMNNKAAALARGSIIGLINNDIDVIDADWLAEMVALAAKPEYGAVGAKLLYPDRRLQHAGVVLGLGGTAGHLYWGAKAAECGYLGRLELPSNVLAVTAACLVVRKALFDEVGGLNAVDLPVGFSDIDFCFKLAARGYLNVWSPYALLYHHESPTRGFDHISPEKAARAEREWAYMQKTWGEIFPYDPFYNANLSLDNLDCELATPPRRSKPWKKPAVDKRARS
jgi:GT2 family glycosyltransferase